MKNKLTSIFELPVRIFGPVNNVQFKNIEKISEFDFSRTRIIRKKGVSAMLRAKNEADIIEECITRIVDVFDEIVFIDNNSSDNTLSIVRKLAQKHSNIQIYEYPYNISRCGVENKNTDENSIHSLAYFYNWCVSKCKFGYIMKWDADMFLSSRSRSTLSERFGQLSSFWPIFLQVEIQTTYRKNEEYYLSLGEVNSELMIFPNRADCKYIKADDFELFNARIYSADTITHDTVKIYEIKDTSRNEFAHWDTLDFPTERKKLEYERFKEISNNIMTNFEKLDL